MFILHYAPDNASLIIRLALDELGLPFQTVLVDRKANEQRGAAYRKLNPRGMIPVLETPHGPIFETGAILLYLNEVTDRLAPAPGSPARPAFLAWLFALSNGLQTDLRMRFYADRYAGPDPAAQAALRACAMDRIDAMLNELDRCAAQGETWIGRQDPSLIDLYLCPMLRWLALYPVGQAVGFDLLRWPALRTLAARIETRPSVQRAQAAEGLGPTPFTAPSPADPPEGSAL